MDNLIRPFGFYFTQELSYFFPVTELKIYYVCDGLTYLLLYVMIGKLIIGKNKFWENVFHIYCIPMAVNVLFEYTTSDRFVFDWTEGIAAIISVFIILVKHRDFILLKMFAYISK